MALRRTLSSKIIQNIRYLVRALHFEPLAAAYAKGWSGSFLFLGGGEISSGPPAAAFLSEAGVPFSLSA